MPAVSRERNVSGRGARVGEFVVVLTEAVRWDEPAAANEGRHRAAADLDRPARAAADRACRHGAVSKCETEGGDLV